MRSLLLIAVGLVVSLNTGLGLAQTTLKEAFKNDFLIGVAINTNQIYEHDARGLAIITNQFDSVTPENVLKWEAIHPTPDRYNFEPADRFVDFGEKYHMAIIGHCLVWHSQTPKWVFQDADGKPVDRETLLNRMSNHIHTVVGRYKGRIKGWDVVNEALYDSGLMRQSPWFKIIGEDYIEKAFEVAHEADPGAELYYNDYSLETEAKRKGAIALIKKLQDKGIPVTGAGLQCHIKLKWPSAADEDATMTDFAKLGVKIMVTEMDVDVVRASQANRSADVSENAKSVEGGSAYAQGLPPEQQQELAQRYADLFKVFIKHRKDLERVTIWGVTDGDSWLNSGKRVNYPLLFDREGRPKQAFEAVIKTATEGR